MIEWTKPSAGIGLCQRVFLLHCIHHQGCYILEPAIIDCIVLTEGAAVEYYDSVRNRLARKKTFK